MSNYLPRVLSFLRGVGIPCDITPGASGFIVGVRIYMGGLQVSPDARVSNILHEAGHLAVLPGRFRRLACDDIDAVVRLMNETVDFSNPDVGEARAAMQSGDAEATAWAWAVGEHLNLPPETVIEDADYDGTGEDMRASLMMRGYLGINGLASAGFCVVRPGALEKARKLPAYPRLAMWVQHDFESLGAGRLTA